MIEFRKEWAAAMDGGQDFITARVRRVELVESSGAGQAVDYALAASCQSSSELEQVEAHLNYIITQLVLARSNIKKYRLEMIDKFSTSKPGTVKP